MADQVNNDIERLKTEESNHTVIEDDEPLPTTQEWRTLPKVADHLPLVVWFVVICELCERFTFYGVSGPFQNYIQHPPPTEEHGQPGAIGAGQQVATSLNYFFSFFCYFTPLLGAIIADQVFGRYKTILVFCIVYMFGLTVLTTTAIPPAIVAKVSLPGLIVSMIIIGLGTGGIKCNVSPLVADQYTRTKPYVKTLGDGKKVIVDPKMTVQSIFHWFYLAINIGSFSSLLTTYLEKYHSFWLAYLVPLIMFFGAIGVLITFRNNYIKKPPQGSILLVFLRVLKTAFFNGRSLDNVKPSNLSKESALKSVVTWSDDFVDQVKKGLRACRVFLFYPIYWVCYIQMTSNLTSQASVMKVGNVPNDVMTNLNPLSLLIFVPFADKVLYPTFQRFGITIRPITRIFIGFMLAASAMAYSAMVQSIIYNAGPCYHNTGCEVDGQVVPNDVSVWIQSPSYILIGFSEVFTSITGLNYAYQQAPEELKSTVTSLYLLTTAAGSALGFLFVPLSKDPHLVQLYSILCVLTVIAGFLLLYFFGKYDKDEEEEEAKRIEEK